MSTLKFSDALLEKKAYVEALYLINMGMAKDVVKPMLVPIFIKQLIITTIIDPTDKRTQKRLLKIINKAPNLMKYVCQNNTVLKNHYAKLGVE